MKQYIINQNIFSFNQNVYYFDKNVLSFRISRIDLHATIHLYKRKISVNTYEMV